MQERRRAQFRLQNMAEAVSQRSSDPTRHKCFVSYHVADEVEVSDFIESFGTAFIPTVVGVTDDDDFVDSDDTDYIMGRIREEYLANSTVTIVLVGGCTWARRFVDWEVYSSLRRYTNYAPSGLLAITLPSVSDDPARQLPDRVAGNVIKTSEGYARWRKYPSSSDALKGFIQVAFDARAAKEDLIINSRSRKKYNSSCP